MNCDRNPATCSGVTGKMLEQLAERFAKREDFAQIVGAEVRPGDAGVWSFAADLDDSDNLVSGQNRGADHLLDDLGGFAGDFYALKYGGMADSGEIVDDVRAALAGRFRGDGGSAGERDETDILKRFRDEEIKMLPAARNTHQSDFVGLDAEILRDALRDIGEGDFRRAAGIRFEGAGDAFQVRNEAEALGHSVSVAHTAGARREEPGGRSPAEVIRRSYYLSEKCREAQRNFKLRVSEKRTA